jgi:catechol 2,3-dioxygenase-like lactoylglutathione lyase family enzyme
MLDHVGFAVSDLERARKFYQQTLSPLGIMLIYDITAEQTDGEAYLGFGEDQRPYFWVGSGRRFGGNIHVAPGLRPHYHKNYYGAFVLDPDGNNIEAVCHRPA